MNYEKILKSMKVNKRDWEIKDLIVVSKNLNIDCNNRDGSHYVFKHPKVRNNLSIPKHKDLHPDYITKFIRFTDLVMAEEEAEHQLEEKEKLVK